jgi:hypothetical protein
MKRLPAAVFTGIIIVLSISCGSVDLAKKYPNMVADADPVSAGSFTAQFDRFFSSQLRTAAVEVIFHPRLNSTALVFKYQTVTYYQFWDENGRRQFTEALERYKIDYAERNLNNKYRQTRAIYGKINGRLEWESFKLTKTRVSSPVIEIGYRFRKANDNNMPFLTVLMRSAKEQADIGDSSNLVDSQQISMYFTRAQAAELVKLFDQSYLLALVNVRTGEGAGEPLKPDVYTEYEAP